MGGEGKAFRWRQGNTGSGWGFFCTKLGELPPFGEGGVLPGKKEGGDWPCHKSARGRGRGDAYVNEGKRFDERGKNFPLDRNKRKRFSIKRPQGVLSPKGGGPQRAYRWGSFTRKEGWQERLTKKSEGGLQAESPCREGFGKSSRRSAGLIRRLVKGS